MKSNQATARTVTAELSILEAMTPAGHCWSVQEMADILGCSRSVISEALRKALVKLETTMKADPTLVESFNELIYKTEVRHPLSISMTAEEML